MDPEVSTVEAGQVWVVPDCGGPFTVTMLNAHHEPGRTLLRNHLGLTIAISEKWLQNLGSLIYDPALPVQSLAA